MTDKERIEKILADLKHGTKSQMKFKPVEGTILALTYKKEIEEATQSLLTLLKEARIEELKRLKGIDAFNEAYTLDSRPAKLVDIRLKALEEE